MLSGSDVTIVTYGSQVYVAGKAAEMAQADGISCELIDLRTLQPWDRALVVASVQKTGRLIVTHEAPQTSGYGTEIIASVM